MELFYLGHVISKDGVFTDTQKIESVMKWSVPQTITDVRDFSGGFMSYYHQFLNRHMKVASPLHVVISGDNANQKNTAIQWSQECQDTFERVKELCCLASILAFTDFTEPFILHTDASSSCLGAVLYEEINGRERVIGFYSHGLSKSDSNYMAHKLKFLVLKWSITTTFHE